MISPRFATYSIGGATRYGAVTAAGIVDLSARFGQEYPTLREAIAAGALARLAEDAAKRSLADLSGVRPYDPGAPCEILVDFNTSDHVEKYRYRPGVEITGSPITNWKPPITWVGL